MSMKDTRSNLPVLGEFNLKERSPVGEMGSLGRIRDHQSSLSSEAREVIRGRNERAGMR